MKKAILISIRPEWVADILDGEKTIEIRKTAPKCELPIDVYIYCTEPHAKEVLSLFVADARPLFDGRAAEFIERKRVDAPGMRWSICNGKVVAKFTLNKIENFINGMNELELEWDGKPDAEYDYFAYEKALDKACLTYEEADKYCPDQSFYAWHISDLEIFDKPKELSDFRSLSKTYHHDHESMVDYYERKEARRLKRAPQSWRYVEVEE